ncbi:MAG: SPOR domain-containing protein [Desulfobacterales bacterium]
MVQLLKHLAFRLWSAVILGGLTSLGVLALIGAGTELPMTLVIVGATLLLFFWVSGWMSSHVGISLVRPLLTEAGVWERSGLTEEADRRFAKALSLFDSFMLSPAVRRKHLPEIIGRMAQFYLALPDTSARGETVIRAYLDLHPEDEALAAAWLQGVLNTGSQGGFPEETAARIGAAHPRNASIQEALARLYLAERRTDFSALQAYRRLMKLIEPPPPDMIGKLSRILLDEGRSDEWALSVYLSAVSTENAPDDVLRGIAACRRWMLETHGNREMMAAADHLLAHLDDRERERMTAGFVPPGLPAGEPTEETTGPSEAAPLKTLSRPASHVLEWSRRTIDAAANVLRRSGWMLRAGISAGILRWVLIGAISAGAAALLINTAGYLRPDRPELPPETTPIAVETAPEPYTIQVAAYLKPDYARKYVESLKAMGLDAYVLEATGNGKTWYQVRISRFSDKRSALDYGEKLNREGLIEEFYVARSSPDDSGGSVGSR